MWSFVLSRNCFVLSNYLFYIKKSASLHRSQKSESSLIYSSQNFFKADILSDLSVRFMINRYANLTGIEQPITPHMFRDSLSTLLLK